MGYVRITIRMLNGHTQSGVRKFPEPMNLGDIRMHAWHLAAEALGRRKIEDVTVCEVPADDPAVVALILHDERNSRPTQASAGEHPYVKQQQRRPPR